MSTPTPFVISADQLKPWLIAMITGVILLVVGAVAGTVAFATGDYIVGTLNKTGVLTIKTTFLADVATIISPIFTIIGVTLIVVAIVGIIRLLLRSVEEMTPS